MLPHTNNEIFTGQEGESTTLFKLSGRQKVRFLSLLWLIFQSRKAHLALQLRAVSISLLISY